VGWVKADKTGRGQQVRKSCGRSAGKFQYHPRKKEMKRSIRGKYVFAGCFLILFLVVVSYTTYLYRTVTERFEGKIWDIPSQVYSTAFAISPGMDVNSIRLLDRLRRLNYRPTLSILRGALRDPK